jgi:2-polyprenyl-6-methoxyphenol hydroxylase-like FAD-dependent oxidoreductase
MREDATAGRTALVIGGSIGGLFAALVLRRHGWDVTVFERAANPLAGRGAGIVTHPQLLAILREIGVTSTDDLGVEIHRRTTFAPDGTMIGTYPYRQIATSWDRLFNVLRDLVPQDCYCHAKDLLRIEQDEARVVAHFRDGTSAAGDLLVGADGLRSHVRGQVLGNLAPLYAGYTAWRGLLHEAEMPPEAHADLFEDFAFCLPAGEQILGYPVAGADNDLRIGHRRYNVIWYRPADERVGLKRLLTDINGREHAISIPPPLIRPELVAEMRRDARHLLAPQFAAVMEAVRAPFLQPIFDLACPSLAFGRVALLGDAAFVARPHVGAGVTKAAEDAVALAEALDGQIDVAASLRRFDVKRLQAGNAIIRRARHLGAYMQAEILTAEERLAAERHFTPQAVMAETAMLDF